MSARRRDPAVAGGSSRADAVRLDRRDPLARTRRLFELPRGVLYFDGNSLGPLPRASRERLRRVVDVEWGRDLVRSWNLHDWISMPLAVGAKIAPLVGAAPDEVVVADSTSVDLYKLLTAALGLRPGRRRIVTESEGFPTDRYVARSAAETTGATVRLVEPDELEDALDGDVAVVSLSHVDYRTGELRDMAALTRLVHAAGALALWDLSHSAGALGVDLGGCGVDLAVGCGYKFLNGGPGAPAYLYVAERWQAEARTPIAGWLGHRDPFAFEADYRPAPGVARFLCGTPPILSLAAFDAALGVFDGVDLEEVRRKSIALGDLFLDLVEERCGGLDVELGCPRDGRRRGSQVVLRHPEGYAVMQALIERGVVGDFRPPDRLRFGLTPLYLRYVDVWDAVDVLVRVLTTRAWDHPRHRRRAPVT